MIHVKLSGLIMAFMLISVGLVCVLWLWTLWRERRREVQRRRIAIQCRLCNFTYVLPPPPAGTSTVARRLQITTCPACNAQNQKGALESI
jgi:Zn finger protein HypA/HybF involved in hydrogenase expression